MKIGIDGRLWNETGVGRYIRNLVLELQRIDKKNEYVLFVKTGIRNQELGIKNEKWKIVTTDIHWHSLQEQVQFPQLLYKENLDLMHFPYFSLPILYNKPFVVTIHDLIITHFPTGKASTLPYPLYRLKRIGYDLVLQHAVKKSRKVIVSLHTVKKDLIETLHVPESKIAITYEGGSNFKSQNAKISASQKYFLYVGNAYPHKNVEFLISAFLMFRKNLQKDVQLFLVGKDDYFYQRLRMKLKKEKIEGVIFKHGVTDEELFSLYSHAIAFVSASKMEGFGLPPLEAMHAPCPLLLSDIPAFHEVCRDIAWYFNPYKEHSLVEQFHFVYNLSNQEKQKHTVQGVHRVNDFSWKKMAEETQKIYESSLSL